MTVNKTAAATIVAAAAVLSGLTSCKGRTMENMEPTGETVEVSIENDSVIEESPMSDTVETRENEHPRHHFIDPEMPYPDVR